MAIFVFDFVIIYKFKSLIFMSIFSILLLHLFPYYGNI